MQLKKMIQLLCVISLPLVFIGCTAQLPKCDTGACPVGCRQSDNTCGDGSRCCDKVQKSLPCKSCTTP